MPDFDLKPTVGLVAGETIQFAIARGPGDIGIGVALSDEAFDVVEPYLSGVCPNWTHERRYGVTELPQSVVEVLVHRLRSGAQSEKGLSASNAELLGQLADWLEARRGGEQAVSILGY